MSKETAIRLYSPHELYDRYVEKRYREELKRKEAEVQAQVLKLKRMEVMEAYYVALRDVILRDIGAAMERDSIIVTDRGGESRGDMGYDIVLNYRRSVWNNSADTLHTGDHLLAVLYPDAPRLMSFYTTDARARRTSLYEKYDTTVLDMVSWYLTECYDWVDVIITPTIATGDGIITLNIKLCDTAAARDKKPREGTKGLKAIAHHIRKFFLLKMDKQNKDI